MEPGRWGVALALMFIGPFVFCGWVLLLAAIHGPKRLLNVQQQWWVVGAVGVVLGLLGLLRFLLFGQPRGPEFVDMLLLGFVFGSPLLIPYFHCVHLRCSSSNVTSE